MRLLLTTIVLAVALVFLISLVFVACEAHGPRTTEKEPLPASIATSSPDSGVLTVAHRRDYPPYEYVNANGLSAGTAIDVISEVARRLGLEVRFRALSWPEVLKELSLGKGDVAPCMEYSPARAKEWALSVAWGKATSVVYVRRTSKFETVADVVPKRVAAALGDIEYEALKLKGVNQLIGSENTEEALMKTVVGEVAGAGCNREVAHVILERHVGLKTTLRQLEPPLTETLLMVGSRKGNEPLLYRISRVLLEMKRDRTLERLTSAATDQTSS